MQAHTRALPHTRTHTRARVHGSKNTQKHTRTARTQRNACSLNSRPCCPCLVHSFILFLFLVLGPSAHSPTKSPTHFTTLTYPTHPTSPHRYRGGEIDKMLNSHRGAPCSRGRGDYPPRWERAARGSRGRHCAIASWGRPGRDSGSGSGPGSG